jgi:hypothetical protein
MKLNYFTTLSISETFAPVIEAVALHKIWKIPLNQSFLWMILANLFSWWLGIYLSV